MKGILCFGDSLTFDRGDGENGGWFAKLRKFYETKSFYHGVYNLGICGDTSTDLLKRFDVEADARVKFNRKSDEYLILIAIGLNDSRAIENTDYVKVSKEEFKENINLLADKAIAKKTKVAFIGLTPTDPKLEKGYEGTFFFNDRIKEYNQIIKETCNKKNIPFLDIIDDWMKEDYLDLLSDGIHPNAKGYEKLFLSIKDFLIENKLI